VFTIHLDSTVKDPNTVILRLRCEASKLRSFGAWKRTTPHFDLRFSCEATKLRSLTVNNSSFEPAIARMLNDCLDCHPFDRPHTSSESIQ
jgi:hypothetical protein